MYQKQTLSSLKSEFFTINREEGERLSAVNDDALDAASAPLSGIFLKADGAFALDFQATDGAGAVMISDDQIRKVLTEIFVEPLTSAELSLLKARLCGLSLRQISEQDGVSYETRRNQFKSIQTKADIDNRSDLIARLSALIILRQKHVAEAQALNSTLLRDTLNAHWRCSSRVYPYTSGDGDQLLVAELGPIGGAPVLMMHAAFFSLYPLPSKSNILEELNIRLIVPIRPGYFDNPFEQEDAAEAFDRHIDLVAELVAVYRLADVPVICFAAGVRYGLALVARGVVDAGRMLAVNPSYARNGRLKQPTLHFRAALKLCRSSPRIARTLYKAALTAARTPDAIGFGFGQYFGSSKNESREIDAMLREKRDLAVFKDIISASLHGFVYDLPGMSVPWPDIPAEAVAGLRMIFARDEPYTDMDALKSDPVYGACEMATLGDHGRLGVLNDPELLFERLLSDQPVSR